MWWLIPYFAVAIFILFVLPPIMAKRLDKGGPGW